jgi:group I intron endonuclease
MSIQLGDTNKAGIYKLTCSINGKVYIGKAINISNRMARHKYNCSKLLGRCYFERALIKYGWDSFDVEVLETFEDFDKFEDNDSLLLRESYYIDLYDSTNRDIGYNICKFSSDNTGTTWTDEKKERIRLLNSTKPKRIRKPCSEETKEKIRQAKLGKKLKPHSEETKKKMSLAGKGRILSEETKVKMRKPKSEDFKEKMRSRIHSDESKEKMRQSALGRKFSEETRDKMRQSKVGKKRGPLSDDHKRKIGLPKIGKARSEETKEKLRKAHLGNTYGVGYIHTDEAKEKMRQAKLGKIYGPISEDQKQQISKANRGRKHTPEAIEKMREAARIRNLKRKETDELQELYI